MYTIYNILYVIIVDSLTNSSWTHTNKILYLHVLKVKDIFVLAILTVECNLKLQIKILYVGIFVV